MALLGLLGYWKNFTICLNLANRWRLVANGRTRESDNAPADWLCRKLLGTKSRPMLWLLMAISTTELTLMSNEAAGQQAAEKTAHGLTCNLDGIPSQEREHYRE